MTTISLTEFRTTRSSDWRPWRASAICVGCYLYEIDGVRVEVERGDAELHELGIWPEVSR